MSTLAIIPARGGSKGVRRKNIRPFGGKPLIAWTIETALACAALDRVVVSTEDEEIAEVAVALGAEVPFIRPAELAADETPDLPVYDHVLARLSEDEGYEPHAVAWLRPTSPLRIVEDIDGALGVLAATRADTVRSVSPVAQHPYEMYCLGDDARLTTFSPDADDERFSRRQLFPVHVLNGAVDVVLRSSVAASGVLFGGDLRAWVMPPERGVNLDTELDFALGELVLARSVGQAT